MDRTTAGGGGVRGPILMLSKESKPYRKVFLADVRQYLEKMDVVWSIAMAELGSHLTDLNSN